MKTINPTIILTDSAVNQLHLLQDENDCNHRQGLRIFVETGGCSGMQYGMRFDQANEDDQLLETNGARILVDPYSQKYLAGSTLDFVDGLTGAGFKLHNPNASRSCGCGTSFEYNNAAH